MSIEERRERAARIRKARKDAHLTQTGLAQLVGVHRNTVQNWEKGLAPHEDDLLKAEMALGIVPPLVDLNLVDPDIYALLVAVTALMQAVDVDKRRTITEALVSALIPQDVPEPTGDVIEPAPSPGSEPPVAPGPGRTSPGPPKE